METPTVPAGFSARQSTSELESSGPVRAARVDFSAQLLSAKAAVDSRIEPQQKIAALLQDRTAVNVVALAAFGDDERNTLRIDSLLCPWEGLTQSLRESLQTVAAECLTECRSKWFTMESPEPFQIGAVPQESEQCVVIARKGSVGFLLYEQTEIELAAAHLSSGRLPPQQTQGSEAEQQLAALIEIISHCESAPELDIATQRLADGLKDYLKASAVAVGLCEGEGLACRLQSHSNHVTIDRRAEEMQLAEAVLQEAAARGGIGIWPAQDDSNRHALLSHLQYANHQNAGAVVSTPLRNEQGTMAGAVFAVFHGDDSAVPASAARFLRAAERAVATSLTLQSRSMGNPVRHLLRRFLHVLTTRKIRTGCVLLLTVTALMLLPVPYRVSCDLELQPKIRRYIAAPFDAPLRECLVSPGDIVQQDELLARLDDREIRWEYSGTQADLSKATKERNAFLVEHETGDAEISRHEMQRLQNRVQLLNHRGENLEIRSPYDGIVVSGDHKDSEGVPLETGQTLFEIAPLDQLVTEIAIPEEDIRWIQPGMSVTLRLDALPSENITANILRIHPRAELRDHENVFIAEAVISNEDQMLRPGMRGTSRIDTGWSLLGWNLFHKPCARLIGWMGW